MASIQTAIQLTDGVTSTLHNIVNALNMTISTFEEVQRAGNLEVDPQSFSGIREEINSAAFAVQNLEQELNGLNVEQTGSLNIDSGNVSKVKEGMESATLAAQNLNHEISNVGLNQINSVLDLDINTGSLIDAKREINDTTSAVQNLDKELNNINVAPLQELNDISVNIDGFGVVTDEINNATTAAQNLGQNLNNLNSDSIRVEIEPVWKSVDMPVFTTTGIERYQQEVQSANKMLNQLAASQKNLQSQSARTNLLSANAIADLASLDNRIVALKDRLNSIDPIDDIGADRASNAVEGLREQIDQALAVQEELNQALGDMDVSKANSAYQELNTTIGSAEKYIRDNTTQQEALNSSINKGVKAVSGLAAGFAMAVTNKAINAVTSSLDSAISRIDTLNNYPKVMQQMGYSAEAAEASVQRLSDGVQGLPTALDSVVSTSQRLSTLTKNINLATETTLALNNAFLASGSSSDAASRGMEQYIQMLSKGSVDGQSWKTLQETMPYALDKVATAFGYAGASAQNDLLNALQEGTITVSELNNKFIELSNETGGFAEVALTATGGIQTAITNMGTAITKGVAEIINAFDSILANTSFGSLEGLISSIGTTFKNVLTEISDKLTEAGPLVENFFTTLSNVGQTLTLIWQEISPFISIAMGLLSSLLEMISNISTFIQTNWSTISPIIYGIVAALAAYVVISTIVGIINGVVAATNAVKAAAEMMANGATLAHTASQKGLNAALAACPLTWIILLIIALIVVIFMVCNKIAELTGIASSGFGIICGGVNVVIQFFKNLALTVANVALGIWEVLKVAANNIWVAFYNAIMFIKNLFTNIGMFIANVGIGIWNVLGAVCENIQTAFKNSISNVKAFFYDLLGTVLSVISEIASALNKLPFIEFDAAGLASSADAYAAKAQAERDSKGEYTSLSDAFSEGFNTYDAFKGGWLEEGMKELESFDGVFESGYNTFDTFQDGWVSEAFNSGAAWGDGVVDKISNLFGGSELPGTDDYLSNFEDVIDDSGLGSGAGSGLSDAITDTGVGSNLGSIANDTGAIADSVAITQEELKYLRDIAERDVVNRFTTAELKVEFTSNNNISSDMDLDGVVSYLEDKVSEALEATAEGVHV